MRDAPRDADGTLFHLLGGREVWADTVYMVVPFLALSGRPDLAMAQVEGHRRRLCTDGLLGDLVGRDVVAAAGGSLGRRQRHPGTSAEAQAFHLLATACLPPGEARNRGKFQRRG